MALDFDKYSWVKHNPEPVANKSLPRKAELTTLKKYGADTSCLPMTREDDLKARRSAWRAGKELMFRQTFRDDALAEAGLSAHPKRQAIFDTAVEMECTDHPEYHLGDIYLNLCMLKPLFIHDRMEDDGQPKRIYIMHPLTTGQGEWADMDENVERYLVFCAFAALQGHVVISWVHNYLPHVRELTQGDHAFYMKGCLALLSQADEVWVCGPPSISKGIRMEIAEAKRLGITVCRNDLWEDRYWVPKLEAA